MAKNEVTVTFYSEHTDDPKTWASPRPSFDLAKFNRELERRGGSIGNVPRYRCRWAGEHDEYIIEEYDTHTGYTFHNEKGELQFVPATEIDFEFPDGAIANPEFDHTKIFTPRFVIEEYREPFYHKAWFVEEVKVTSKEYGRVELISHYRAPSEVDLGMAEHHAYLKTHLTPEQIAAGIAQLDAVEAIRKAQNHEELKNSIAEETVRALTDGIPWATARKFGFNPKLKFDIHGHSKSLIQEHDKKS